MSNALLIVVGLVGLVGGAELLVRGGTGVALRLGIAPIVIGGNIVGTNLVNVLLILGLSALISPIVLDRRTVRFDLPVMTGASLLLLVLALDGTLGTLDGILLLIVGAGYTFGILRTSRRETPAVQAQYDAEYVPQNAGRKSTRPWLDVLSLLAGIAVIVLGAALLVDGAVDAGGRPRARRGTRK